MNSIEGKFVYDVHIFNHFKFKWLLMFRRYARYVIILTQAKNEPQLEFCSFLIIRQSSHEMLLPYMR